MESWHPNGDTNVLYFSSVMKWSSVVFHAFSIQAALKYSLVFSLIEKVKQKLSIKMNYNIASGFPFSGELFHN